MSNDEKDRFGDKLRDAEHAREDKFFAECDRTLLQKLRHDAAERLEHDVLELARGRCPRCSQHLTKKVHHNVEIHQCPAGHGVWLDDGALDTLVARESSGWLSRVLGRTR